MQGKPYRDFLYTTQEGLRLYARDYGERTAPKTPVICTIIDRKSTRLNSSH